MALRANNTSKARFQGNNAAAGARLKKGGSVVVSPSAGSLARIIERTGLESVTVRGELTTSSIVIDATTLVNDYTIPASISASLFGPITFTGTVTVDGTLNIF